jgi:quercetin dioxygenase-like cupin family protein
MENRKIDLKKVLGVVAEYDEDQKLISPDRPFEVKATFYPGAASIIHIHPYQDEYYKVHQGEIELYLDGEWKVLKAGEEAFIQKKAVHGFRNTSSHPAYLTNIHTPGLNFGASLVAMESLARAGKIDGVKGFKNLVYLSLHSLNYMDTVVSVNPPGFVLKLMAKFGALFGYKL